MKLKTYIIPDFKTIEIRSERYCDGAIDGHIVSQKTNNLSTVGGDVDDGQASIFRDGIWDED